jgi:hypothetical protein
MKAEEQEAFDRLHPEAKPKHSMAGICGENDARATERAYLARGVASDYIGKEPSRLSDELTDCDLTQDDKNFYDDTI